MATEDLRDWGFGEDPNDPDVSPENDPDVDQLDIPTEPINLRSPPVSVKPLPRLPPLSLQAIECIKHAKYKTGVFKVLAMLDGHQQLAILKVVSACFLLITLCWEVKVNILLSSSTTPEM